MELSALNKSSDKAVLSVQESVADTEVFVANQEHAYTKLELQRSVTYSQKRDHQLLLMKRRLKEREDEISILKLEIDLVHAEKKMLSDYFTKEKEDMMEQVHLNNNYNECVEDGIYNLKPEIDVANAEKKGLSDSYMKEKEKNMEQQHFNDNYYMRVKTVNTDVSKVQSLLPGDELVSESECQAKFKCKQNKSWKKKVRRKSYLRCSGFKSEKLNTSNWAVEDDLQDLMDEPHCDDGQISVPSTRGSSGSSSRSGCFEFFLHTSERGAVTE